MSDADRRKWSLLIFLPAAALFSLFAWQDQPERGLLAGYSAAVILTAVLIKWRLRESPFFWVIIGAAALVHAVAVAMINLPRLQAPGIFAVPLCVIDIAAIFGLLSLVGETSSS